MSAPGDVARAQRAPVKSGGFKVGSSFEVLVGDDDESGVAGRYKQAHEPVVKLEGPD